VALSATAGQRETRTPFSGGTPLRFNKELANFPRRSRIMALYLVQHGKSLPKDVDPEQGLSDLGKSDVARIAAVAEGYGVRVSAIAHSGKKRAADTARIIAAALGVEDRVTRRDGLNPLDDVEAFSKTIDATSDLMLVGHLPFMQRLTAYLTAGTFQKTIFKFQNGGIVCLDRDATDGQWYIKWTLMPEIG
jgi:phosphohistidine phosphatase